MARKVAGLSSGAILVLIILIVGVLAYTGNLKIPGGLLGTTTPAISPGAQCAFTGGSTPPLGCSNMQSFLQIAPTDVSSGTALAASTYSIQVWIFSGGSWTAGETQKCGAAPTTCTTGASYNPGTQISIQLCANQTPSCTSVDYGQQKTQIACPLPSLAAPTNLPCSLGLGPGAGFVPWAPGNPSTAPTVRIPFPVTLYAGTAQGNNTPYLWTWTAQNGTAYQAAYTCFVKSGTKNCGLPAATSLGRFTLPISIQANGAGTNPANPASVGYASFTDPHFSTAGYFTGRGLLNIVLTIEVKATTNTDMCTVSSTNGIPGSLTRIANSNSATDVFYIWTLPDSAATLVTDSNGNPQTINGVTYTGLILGTITFDCNSVYNGSGDVVTITPLVYSFWSMAYFQTYNGASTNPEKQTASQSAVLTVKT